jgi:hypothetical protein
MEKYLVTLLMFVTLWVLIIAVGRYLIRRTRVVSPGGRQAAWPVPAARALPAAVPMHGGQVRCCLEVPCSEACARDQQAWRDRATARYDLVIGEMRNLIDNDGAPDADGYSGQAAG